MSARNGVRARKNKERSKNFTELEKKTVLELINQYKEVLKQGRSNNATNKSKQMVWSQICNEVNERCQAECPRTPAQVKMWYENYKKKCKMRSVEPGTEENSGLIDGMIWQNINPPPESVIKDERDSMSVPRVDICDDHPIDMSNDHLEERGIRDLDSKEAIQLVVTKDHIPLVISHSPGEPSPLIKSDSPPLQLADIRSRLLPLMSSHSSTPCLFPQESTSNMPLNLSHLESTSFDASSPQEDLREASPSYSNVNFANRHNLPSSQIFPNKKNPKPRNFFPRTNNLQENNCCERTSITDHSLPSTNPNNNGNIGNYFCSNSSPTEEEKMYYITKRQHAIFEHDLRMKTLNMELRYKEEVFSLQKQLFLIELKLKMDFLEKSCNQ